MLLSPLGRIDYYQFKHLNAGLITSDLKSRLYIAHANLIYILEETAQSWEPK